MLDFFKLNIKKLNKMELEVLKQKVNEKLDLLHSENITLKVLYGALENCSNEDFTYHRDIIFESFNNNDSLLDQKDGKFYYAFTDILFLGDPEETAYNSLIESILENKDLSLKEIIDLTEMTYKRFVASFLRVCLIRIDNLNEALF